MVTLKDIAKEAGVSVMTVSRVVNGQHSKVSSKHIEKIQKIIKERGYIPSSAARSLSSKSSHIISVIIRGTGNQLKDSYFASIYVWSDVWQHTGWDSIIYIAALSVVDQSLYEAAIVDGASRAQRIWYIDIPMLLPTAIILLILRVGNLMGLGFEKVYLMQNNLNLPVSEVISTYVYKIGITSAQYSYSAAINMFNTVINFILLITVNYVSKKVSDNSLW